MKTELLSDVISSVADGKNVSCKIRQTEICSVYKSTTQIKSRLYLNMPFMANTHICIISKFYQWNLIDAE